MFVILLSGGAGKRLWPLSRPELPKQFMPIFPGGLSMAQRVYAQLQDAGLADNSVLCAGADQLPLIREQLGEARAAVEPERRNTFPAIVLSCAWLLKHMNANESDIAVVMPVDPFVQADYYEKLKTLARVLDDTGADVALLGKRPTQPLSQYGYILPREDRGEVVSVAGFEEKPDRERAQALISRGALWNMGVFCLRIGFVRRWIERYGVKPEFECVLKDYASLPSKSFDYEVLEHATNLAALRFEGEWCDLGTWDQMSGVLPEATGDVRQARSPGSFVYNTTSIPVSVIGIPNAVVVATPNGILVTNKEHAGEVRP